MKVMYHLPQREFYNTLQSMGHNIPIARVQEPYDLAIAWWTSLPSICLWIKGFFAWGEGDEILSYGTSRIFLSKFSCIECDLLPCFEASIMRIGSLQLPSQICDH